jgi:hypothetical protein
MAGWLLLRVACRASSEFLLEYVPHPAQSLGVGQKEEEGTARSRRAGLDERRVGSGCSGRPDPLLHSDGPPPLEAQSSIPAGGDAGVSRGDWGCRKTPPEGFKSNPVKQRRILHRADEHFSNAPLVADGPKCTEIVALLAEILVLDYQEHKQITVGSPPQSNRNIRLNSLRLVQDEE